MDLIEQYRILHKNNPNYGNGVTHLKEIKYLIELHQPEVIIDYGCGKGNLTRKLCELYPSLVIEGYDPAIPEYSKSFLSECDLLIANDVLEHFDPSTLSQELQKISSYNPSIIFLNISCRPAVHKLPNGLNCHTSLFHQDEWVMMLEKEWPSYFVFYKHFNESNRNLILTLMRNS